MKLIRKFVVIIIDITVQVAIKDGLAMSVVTDGIIEFSEAFMRHQLLEEVDRIHRLCRMREKGCPRETEYDTDFIRCMDHGIHE